MSATALSIEGLRKSFGAKDVLRGVSLDVEIGEIRALLGANGAGKSTLIGCLSGALQPDAGSITVDGQVHTGFTPRTAFDAGIAVIYQHFSLIEPLSVADNIFLGDERVKHGTLRPREQEAVATELLQMIGAGFSPRTEVSRLTVGERQLVEIAKVLRREPKVLVLDEPTAALGEREARLLGERLLQLRDSRDIAIIYVTHLLHEVFSLADSITVLRDGAVALEERMATVHHEDVIAAISPSYQVETRRRSAVVGDDAPVLSLKGLHTSFVGPLDLDLAPGQVTALFGLMGSGRTEILETLMGMRTPSQGQMFLRGRAHRPGSPSRAIADGFALVPADRKQRGVFAQLSSADNVLLPHVQRLATPIARHRSRERNAFARVADRVRLQPADPTTLCRHFSGGNQQKLVVGRWLVDGGDVDVLLLDEPTQGIDIGARGDLYRLIRETVTETATTIVFASSDPEEVLLLADRVLVLQRGRIVVDAPADSLTEQDLLAAAHGSSTSELESEVA
ncbi:MAG: transporter ATP-binding protein [Ilumatobacteraceae bacterium]|nr:transporter ATP-binding protein [Ilumatobacteraceae bacterium]